MQIIACPKCGLPVDWDYLPLHECSQNGSMSYKPPPYNSPSGQDHNPTDKPLRDDNSGQSGDAPEGHIGRQDSDGAG